MVKLEVISKENYIYILLDENRNEFSLNLQFFDIAENPSVGNYIYMSEELLNPYHLRQSLSYVFGSLDSKYGKENIALDDVDVIKIDINGSETYLKRLYG